MKNNNPNPTVQLFVTCLVDALYPQVGMATVDVLESQGCQVQFPEGQTCCGQPAFNVGAWKDARKMAQHTLDVLSETEGSIVLPSGSCTDMIVHHYAELFADDPDYLAKATAVSARTYELTQFLVDVLGVKDVGGKGNGRVTYHPSCHGLRNLGLDHQAQTLLDHVDGIERVELPEAETCCGFGGLFAVKMSAISGAMLKRKLDNLEASGADTLIGGDVSCLMHMAGGLEKRNCPVKTKHIAELLAENLQSPISNLQEIGD